MKDGLEEFLKRIEEKPTNETLIDRFITLVLEEDGMERILYLKKLVGLLLNPNPYAALKAAALELQEARKEKLTKEYEIGALKDVESCFLKLDKVENAALVREEINKLSAEGVRTAVPSSKNREAMNPPFPQDQDYSSLAQHEPSPQDLRRARLHFRLPRQDEDDNYDDAEEATQQEYGSPTHDDPRLSFPPQLNPFDLPDEPTEKLDMDALHPNLLQKREAAGERDLGDDQPFYDRRPDPAMEPRRSSLSQVSGLKLGPNLLDEKAGEEAPRRNPVSVFDPSELLNMDDEDSYTSERPLDQNERTQVKAFENERSPSSPSSKDIYNESQNLHFAESHHSTKKDLARASNQPQTRPTAPQAPTAPQNASRSPAAAKPPDFPARSPEPAPSHARQVESGPPPARHAEPAPSARQADPFQAPFRSPESASSRPSEPMQVQAPYRSPEAPPSRPSEPMQAQSRQPEAPPKPAETPLRTMRVDPRIPAAPPSQPSPRGMMQMPADEPTELLKAPWQAPSPDLEFTPPSLKGGPTGDSGMKTMVDPVAFPPTSVSKPALSGTATRGQPTTQVNVAAMVPPAQAPGGSPTPQAQASWDDGDSQRALRWDLLKERMRLLSGVQINRSHANEFVQRLTGDQGKELTQRAMGLIMSFVDGREIPHLHQKISALLFEEVEPRAMHQLWVSLRMQEMGAHFYGAYLHDLMRDQQYRRALNIVHAVIVPGLDGHWYRMSYGILMEIWERLGLRGWAWLEEEGPLLFCERLSRREDLLPATLLA